MSSASILTCELINCFDAKKRAEMYDMAGKTYGKSFADHLRDQVEAHHLIVANERAIQLEASAGERQSGESPVTDSQPTEGEAGPALTSS